MSVSDSGGLGFGAVSAAAARGGASSSATRTPPKSAVEDFLNYMKESPAERMADSWLAAHGLSKEELAAMSPERREAVLRQMAKELADRAKQQISAGGDRRQRL